MLLHTTTMSSPAVEFGACRPLDAVGPSASGVVRLARHPGRRRRPDGRRDPPGGPVGSICPDTKNAPSCDGAEKLRNIACPAKLPRTANRLLRSLRRQTKLSAETPPSVSAGFTATGCQAQFLPLTEKHTFANAPGFRDEVPASPLLAQLPMDFGRIVLSVKPYSPGLPLSRSARTVPPVAVPGEVPHLDCSYCAP